MAAEVNVGVLLMGELTVNIKLKVNARSKEDADAIADSVVDDLRGFMEIIVEAANERDDLDDTEKTLVEQHGNFAVWIELANSEDWKEGK